MMRTKMTAESLGYSSMKDVAMADFLCEICNTDGLCGQLDMVDLAKPEFGDDF